MDIETFVSIIAPQAAAWIATQRDRHRPFSSSIDTSEGSRVSAYFDVATIRRARLTFVDGLENPQFYGALQNALPGIALIDFSEMTGITFDDVIVIRGRPSQEALRSILFHELVHVVQYSLLSVSEFAKRYVRGWAECGMQYATIPLERDAYGLQDRFDGGETPFSVEHAVTAQLSQRAAT